MNQNLLQIAKNHFWENVRALRRLDIKDAQQKPTTIIGVH